VLAHSVIASKQRREWLPKFFDKRAVNANSPPISNDLDECSSSASANGLRHQKPWGAVSAPDNYVHMEERQALLQVAL